MAEKIDLVNKRDEIIGSSTVKEAHRKHLLHRAVHVFVFNNKGELFLQKRSKNSKLYPNYWDASVGEHVKAGEGYREAAIRGLKEELSIEGAEIREIARIEVDAETNREITALFKCVYGGKIKIDRNELEEGRFFKIKEISGLMEKRKFTPFFKVLFGLYMGTGK